MTRFIFITGGVISSIGKGLASAALASLLQTRGFKVRLRKLDPYLNVDPGTMSPYQHGEVYVTDDGAETDLDLGHYERFTGIASRHSDNITTGRIYSKVIARERKGEYLGDTVQVIPHVTDAIKEFILSDIIDEDFVICEIGGTVGDIESLPFLEAIRQLGNELGHECTMFIHLTLLPYISSAGELKTKPTQHSVKELLSVGIQPDLLLCRSDRNLSEKERHKISLFCNVREEAVITGPDVDIIYKAPVSYHEQGFDDQVCKHFNLFNAPPAVLTSWNKIIERIQAPEGEVTIAIVGKYIKLLDSYKSLSEALQHGGIANNVKVRMNWIDSKIFENKESICGLENVHGILVPGGFGERGISGKIEAIKFAREHFIPYFGICFGMQMAVIEVARNLAGLINANSTEFGPCIEPVVGLITEWVCKNKLVCRTKESDLGGTMRLGAYNCKLLPKTKVAEIYGKEIISERHRHRYEVNICYRKHLEQAGIIFSGMSPDDTLPEIIELKNHPWFIGVQFHPELKSKPFDPHPLFASFIQATILKSRLI